MYSVPVPTLASHVRSSSATNSGPLSDPMFYSGFLDTASHPLALRSLRTFPVFAPPESPNTPLCIRRSASASAAFCRRASSRSRNHSSTHDSLVPAAAEGTIHLPTTASLAAFVSAALSNPRAPRYPLHAILPYMPAAIRQQSGDPPIAVAPVCAGQRHDLSRRRIFIASINHLVALCPSPLPQQPAGMPLGNPIVLARMPGTSHAATQDFQDFPLPHPSEFASPATAPPPAASAWRSPAPAFPLRRLA